MDKNNFPISFSIDKTFDSDKFLKLRFRLCHDGESPNKTFFTKETMVEANKSLEYIPILAHVYVDEETGKPVIGAHDIHIEEDKLNEGETRVIYDEIPIGVIPSLADNDCAIEEFDGRNYTMVSGFVWRDYSNYAEQLIEEAGDSKISMEIDFSDASLSYDATNDRYNIDAYRYRGVTILNSSLGTGMKNALATTTNFSENNDIKSQMITLMEELQKCLREYDSEEGDNVAMENEEVVVEEPEVEQLNDETVEENTVDTEQPNVSDEETEDDEEVVVGEFVENEPLVCTFRISHDDTRYALQNLLNSLCGENQFLYIESVYDGYFYYADYFTGDAYKQAYKVRKDVVSFNGDPEPVYREFVTQAERDELENMRKNYAALEIQYNELVQFKIDTEAAQLQAKKDAIFAREEFAGIKETKSFKKLVENSKEYSVDECEQKARDILDDFKSFAVNFSAQDNVKKPSVIGFNFTKNEDNKRRAYGSLFD